MPLNTRSARSCLALLYSFIVILTGVCATEARGQEKPTVGAARPNVLMICIDDMNDWVNCLKSYRGTVHTPNIDRLAARGRLFANAHTAFPMCGPSRNAILLGMNPWRTGMYYNGHPWKPNVPDAVPLPAHFKASGYHVGGAGKIFHQGPAYNVPELWSEYENFDRAYKWLPDSGPLNGIDRTKHKLYASMDWGAMEEPHPVMYDHLTVKWTIEQLNHTHDRPFFVTAGIILPHIPWYAPQRFFDMYPLEDVQLPPAPEDDLDDVPSAARQAKGFAPDLAAIDAAGKRREAVRAYLACISYVDHMVGQMLDALDASAHKDNTIVVLWSDHGWHLGEKNWWHKFTLWERSTRVPFIIAAPGVTQPGVATRRAVSLVDLYRTLIDLCALPPREGLDGVSLAPLLHNPSAPRAEPALSTFRHGDYAVRDDRWRYIRYGDGSEELYDHQSDSNEWKNLARDPSFDPVKRDLAKWLPRVTVPLAKVEARTHVYVGETRQWMAKLSAAPATAPVTAGKQAPRDVAFPGGPAWGGRSIAAKSDGTWERFITQAQGETEGATQVCVTESADMGASWSKPNVVGTIGGSGFGGAAAIVTPKGEVHLFMTKTRWVGEGKAPAINRFIDVWYTKSSNGRTEWTKPRAVFEGYVGALCNGAYLKSGRMILPFAMMIGGRAAGPPIGRNETIVLYSDDDGETWPMAPARLVAPVEPNYNGSSEGACEPSVVQLKDGRVWMLMRTQTGFLYESWSNDGVTWSDAKPSQFHASTGPPYLIRLKDDRIALFWNNCEMPPRVDGDGVYGGRDALHAAIGDPEAKNFAGFREIYLDPTRHTTPPKSGDRGTAYPDAVLTADGRIGVSSGQGGRRAVMIVDPAWLMETSRASDFSDGLASWSVYKGFGKATGWWRDRVQGAQLVDHPDKAGAKVLHVRRPDEKDPDGATWNFPMGRTGKFVARVMVKDGSRGGNLALADRFFDPCDATCDGKALFLLPLDRLKPGAWHEVALQWDVAARRCAVTIDGVESPSLSMAHDTPTGVSYLRFRSTAAEPDAAGFLIESVRADVKP